MPSASSARYAARAPWIGPLVGPCSGPGLRVDAAADPLLGKAFAAVFLPVRRKDGKLEPVQPNAPLEGAWVAWPKSDRYGRFQVEVPVGCWGPGYAGVLTILIYDLSGREEPWLERAQKDPQPKLKPLQQSEVAAVGELPSWMQREIEKRMAEFLKQDAARLEAALIAPDPVHCGAAAPQDGVTFAVGSCQYPAGFLDRTVAERSYRLLRYRLASKDRRARPQALLLLGDQIYVDATAGLFDPATRHDRFELPYERLLRTRALRQIVRRIPAYTMLDDHEIADNWEPVAGRDPADDTSFADGRRYYLEYQRMAGPPLGDSREPLWYKFEVNGFPFFMADTRTERSARTAETVESARIMSEAQFQALEQWLRKPSLDPNADPDIPRFVASAASILPRHRRVAQGSPAAALRSDGWDGYPASLRRLLAHIADHRIRNVFFLSGDEHISFTTEAQLSKRGEPRASVYSVHSSALYAPYPFANSVLDNLMGEETVPFGNYSCLIKKTRPAPAGDGFTLLQVAREDGRWRVRCSFIRGRREEKAIKWLDVN